MRKLNRERIDDFNTTYGSVFKSYKALASAEDWRPQTQLSNASVTRDKIEILHAFVYQYYRTAKEAIRHQDPNHLFIGDKLNGNTDAMPRPFGPAADNLAQRAQWTDEFFRCAFARPDFIGWHYCGLIDASQRVPRKRDRQHSGLYDGFGNPYPEIQQANKAATAQLYEIAIRKR